MAVVAEVVLVDLVVLVEQIFQISLRISETLAEADDLQDEVLIIGSDLRYDLSISLEEAYQGKTKYSILHI